MKTLHKSSNGQASPCWASSSSVGSSYACSPRASRSDGIYRPHPTTKKLFVGQEYAAVAGTPWATETALEVLEKGGNACDAAVAALLMLNVTHGEAASFAGVAPTMYYNAAHGRGSNPTSARVRRLWPPPSKYSRKPVSKTS